MAKIAIIPARGGSKRIPRKNIKYFSGKPIIAYSIETALSSGLFNEVMVSTDDDEIAKIAKSYGAKVPFFRSAASATDYATTTEVLSEVLQNYNVEKISFDYACCIYPTAPFVNKEILNESFEKLVNETLDCVFPIVPYSYPIQRALKISDGKTRMLYPENKNTRSQDLEIVYHDAGQFYFFNVKQFLNTGSIWTNNTGSVILSELEVQDIDNETDWKIAEMKYQLKKYVS